MQHNTINHNYHGWNNSPGIFTWEPVRKRSRSQIRHMYVSERNPSGSQCMCEKGSTVQIKGLQKFKSNHMLLD